MATYANMCATANHNAVQKLQTLQPVRPCKAPNGVGWLVLTYTTPQGKGMVMARIVNAQGAVVGYRVHMPNGSVITCNPNLAAMGSLYLPKALATAQGYIKA